MRIFRRGHDIIFNPETGEWEAWPHWRWWCTVLTIAGALAAGWLWVELTHWWLPGWLLENIVPYIP